MDAKTTSVARVGAPGAERLILGQVFELGNVLIEPYRPLLAIDREKKSSN